MSVATKNPFALLDDDDAPSAPQPAPKQESAPASAPQAARGAAQKSRGGPAARGGKYYSRGGKPTSKDSTPVTEEAEGQKKFEGNREGREGGRGRGGRGGRGGGRGGDRGGDRGGRRPFDRHSQTGKTDSDKKVHQSWGGDDGNTELKTEEAANVDAIAESASNEWGADTATADAWATPAADASTPTADGEAKPEGRGRREREPEEEDNTLTFDQYLAQQKEKDAVIPKLENTRKANDGAEDIFKDAVVLAKEEEDAYFVGKGKAAPKARTKKEEKVYLEIDARFERPDRGGGRGGRGGRGGDRGGDRGDRSRGARGRGGPTRGGRQNNGGPSVNVDDQTAFPSLS